MSQKFVFVLGLVSTLAISANAIAGDAGAPASSEAGAPPAANPANTSVATVEPIAPANPGDRVPGEPDPDQPKPGNPPGPGGPAGCPRFAIVKNAPGATDCGTPLVRERLNLGVFRTYYAVTANPLKPGECKKVKVQWAVSNTKLVTMGPRNRESVNVKGNARGHGQLAARNRAFCPQARAERIDIP